MGYWAWLAPGTGIFARLGDRTLAAARARRGTLNAYIRHVRVLNTHQRTAVVPSAVGRVAATQRIPAQAGRGSRRRRPGPPAAGAGFPWGIILAIIADLAISVGLAMQKVIDTWFTDRLTGKTFVSLTSTPP